MESLVRNMASDMSTVFESTTSLSAASGRTSIGKVINIRYWILQSTSAMAASWIRHQVSGITNTYRLASRLGQDIDIVRTISSPFVVEIAEIGVGFVAFITFSIGFTTSIWASYRFVIYSRTSCRLKKLICVFITALGLVCVFITALGLVYIFITALVAY